MAINYPASIDPIPGNSTLMWDDVGDYVVKIATELGINPSGAQADVAARLGVVDDRLTAVEGATSAAGAEVGSATLTSPYSIYQQASSTTWTDIGLSIPVAAQTRAYTVQFSCVVVVTLVSTWTIPRFGAALFRIVDSGVTAELVSQQFPVALPVKAANTFFIPAYLWARVPAGRAASTWKVQAKEFNIKSDASFSEVAVNGGALLPTPGAGVSASPAFLLATTI
jgi:hypothetical protein